MKQLLILGAGGFGREVYCSATESIGFKTEFEIKGFLDPDKNKLEGYKDYPPIIGVEDSYNIEPNDVFICAFGDARLKTKVCNTVLSRGGVFINLVHKEAYISKNVIIGKGNIICKGCLISCDTKIGDFNTFNDFVSIGHNTVIGNYNAFMTATRVSGIVSIGDCNFFGVNSCMVQGIRVGNHTTIGAGSALMRRTKDGYTYIGVPANALVIKK